MSDLPTKHENYSSFVLSGGENDTIFDYPSTSGQNIGQGPVSNDGTDRQATYAYGVQTMKDIRKKEQK